jgi:hypothetical protein
LKSVNKDGKTHDWFLKVTVPPIEYNLIEFTEANPNMEVFYRQPFVVQLPAGEELKSVSQMMKGGEATDVPMSPIEQIRPDNGHCIRFLQYDEEKSPYMPIFLSEK